MTRVTPPVLRSYPDFESLEANPLVRRGKDKHLVLGLDLSSSAVGWALAEDQIPVRMGKFVFAGTAGMGSKLSAFYSAFRQLVRIWNPHELVLERPLARQGSTTSQHSKMLAIVQLVWAENGKDEILVTSMIPPVTVKRVLKVPKGANHAENKLTMVNLINTRLGLNLKFHKSSKLETDDDIADALAVLESHWLLEIERNTPKALAKAARPKKRKAKRVKSS